MRNRKLVSRVALAATLSALLLIPAAASAADGPCYAPPSKPKVISHVQYSGMQSILYCYGPITIRPGQNTIDTVASHLVPSVPGWITRFDPDLIYADKTKGTHGVPSVDVLHLHHAVWAGMSESDPRWAAGEEKTVVQLPRGFGWRSEPSQAPYLNHMIHNLFPTTEHVYLTWRIDFIPDTSPDAATIRRVKAKWLDVASSPNGLPIFDAVRGAGSGGRYNFPEQATTTAQRNQVGPYQYTAQSDMTLVSVAGHLHPGGLDTTLKVRRGSVTKTLFTSSAHYWEPAGAVSWDVAMGLSSAAWRVNVKRGDVLSVSAGYDVSKASWYDVMGIMPVAVAEGSTPGAADPFTTKVPQAQVLTHGHLPENNNHGGGTVPHATNPSTLANGTPSAGATLGISDFIYALGDFSNTGVSQRPPTVTRGQTFTFRNNDYNAGMGKTYTFHTITACANPCNKETGIAYPRANGAVEFDSGNLGFGTGTAQRQSWSIPNNLNTGTYSYFCRVHPYMRGAFRVIAG
ncbi:MAG: hypothetical protein F2799_07460 [Actinobacteria bacterium]|uniref:Unannotated protein n=1 Tax=freshwater metagenome TaxID=449393 RepID=A0A6J7EIV9_9ZZZZ|nr:hypothetical protein [Actinomycetota bacterium]